MGGTPHLCRRPQAVSATDGLAGSGRCSLEHRSAPRASPARVSLPLFLDPPFPGS